MFQLTKNEFLKFQNGISSWGGIRTMPFAFTEQGVSMLSAVLHSPAAIQVSISIMDAFVSMRNYIASTTTLTAELAEIRVQLELLKYNDENMLGAVNDLSEDTRREVDLIYDAISELSAKLPQSINKPRNRIGYKLENE
jgi:hypothetical protein